ncbi:MAG: diaminopimelate epimerase [Oceanicoccus sp.]|jgi:diaminopimelate epimerase
MKKYTFYKYSPGGNETILIENRSASISRENYPSIAKKIMQLKQLQCEQVGFIEPETSPEANGRLHMMGGEYCVNAIRCLAMRLSKENPQKTLQIECSGTNELTKVLIEGENVRVVLDPGKLKKEEEICIVQMPGITHLVTQVKEFTNKTQQNEQMVELLIQYKNQLNEVEAIGYILYKIVPTGVDIRPLIYVRSTESKVYETACGSGSLAVFQDIGQNSLNIIQASSYIYKMEKIKEKVELSSPVISINQGEVCI